MPRWVLSGQGKARGIATAIVLVALGALGVANAQTQQRRPDAAAPAPPPTQAEACYASYGLKPSQKIQICSEAIRSDALKGIPLALAYYNRATALSADGDQPAATSDFREAIRIFTQIIRSSQASAPILFQRGVIYHTIGDSDQAIVDYSDAIRVAPTETYAYVNRGIVLYTKKDNNEGAISDFNAALKLKPCEVTAWVNRGLVYKRKGDLNQSIADFTDALKCLGTNLTPVPASAPANPTQQYLTGVQASTQAADTYFQRGLVKIDKKIYKDAILDFNDAIRLNPGAAAHFVGRASANMLLEQFQPAIADFTEAIRLAPGDAYTFLHRGIAYHTVNEPDNAISDYTEAHKLTPRDVNPLINRGIVYYSKKGLYDLAIADFTEALDIDRKDVNALINRGISYREKGDPDKAIIDFSEALRLGLLTGDVLQFGSKDPDAVRHWAQVAHARYQRGNAYVVKKEYDLALADFNESIRVNPLEARTFVSRGGIFLYRQELERAIADFTEGIRLDPNYAFAYFQRGFAYHALEEPDRATPAFMRDAGRHQTSPVISSQVAPSASLARQAVRATNRTASAAVPDIVSNRAITAGNSAAGRASW